MEGRAAAFLLIVLLAAGCVGREPAPEPLDDAAIDPTNTDAAPEAFPTAVSANASAPSGPAASRVVPLDFEGFFTIGAQACDAAIGCQGHGVFDGETDLEVEGLTGTIDAVSVSVEWSPTSAGTEQLGMGIMTMWRDCEECEDVEFASAIGPSPLTVDLSALNVPIDPRGVLHVYVYPLSAAEGPAFVAISTDQPFTVKGTATLAPPMTAPST